MDLSNNELVHVVLCLYDKHGDYSVYAGVTICSILENTSVPVCIHLFHDSTLTSENREKFIELVSKYKAKGSMIDFVDAEPMYKLQNFAEQQSLAIVSPGTLYRLFTPDLLIELEKCIILDCDIVVDLDIAELWNVSLDDNPIGAVEEDFLTYFVSPIWKICYNPMTKSLLKALRENNLPLIGYFNSGVMLVNLREVREKNYFRQACQYLEIKKNLMAMEQDTLNLVFENNYKMLSQKFNACLWDWGNYKEFSKGIWHYVGRSKPNFPFTPKKDRYKYYRELTPWAIGKTGLISKIVESCSEWKQYFIFMKKALKRLK